MTELELEQLVLKLESRVTALEEIIEDLHLEYVTKLQWTQLDVLREKEINSIVSDLADIQIELDTLQ